MTPEEQAWLGRLSPKLHLLVSDYEINLRKG
jgi:hypothetical protein